MAKKFKPAGVKWKQGKKGESYEAQVKRMKKYYADHPKHWRD